MYIYNNDIIFFSITTMFFIIQDHLPVQSQQY